MSFLLPFIAAIAAWAYTCYRISQEPRLSTDRRALLAAGSVLLGPLAFAYWPWLLLQTVKERED